MSTRRESIIALHGQHDVQSRRSSQPGSRFLSRDTTRRIRLCTQSTRRRLCRQGFGNFLRSPENANEAWKQLAPQFDGRFRVCDGAECRQAPAAGIREGVTCTTATSRASRRWYIFQYPGHPAEMRSGVAGREGVLLASSGERDHINTNCCDLGLSDDQEDDVVAFLKTLTDGYAAPLGSPPSSAVPPAARDN